MNWDPEVASKVSNGCGPAGASWKAWIVPDTIYGLKISPACDIHDFMYHTGYTIEDKNKADSIFLDNLYKLIDNNTSWWNKWLNPVRRVRAYEYYLAVRVAGKEAFLAGKDGRKHEVTFTPEQLKHRDLKKFKTKYYKLHAAKYDKMVA